jgi:hypothetical protein
MSKNIAAIPLAIAAIAIGAALIGGRRHIVQPKPGDRMADGTVYVGISPTDGRPLYAMPYDLTELYTWAGAKTAAAEQTFAGHADWRVPTQKEMNMLYRARDAVGGFQCDWYWSSTEFDYSDAWAQVFSNGTQANVSKNNFFRVRCVRSG